jgi:hypothetical protein
VKVTSAARAMAAVRPAGLRGFDPASGDRKLAWDGNSRFGGSLNENVEILPLEVVRETFGEPFL